MTTIMIEITDEQAVELSQEAARLQVSLQELAIQRLLVPSPTETALPFDEALEYVFRKNAELYRRLA